MAESKDSNDSQTSPRTAVTMEIGPMPRSRDTDCIPTFNFIQATPHESEATWNRVENFRIKTTGDTVIRYSHF